MNEAQFRQELKNGLSGAYLFYGDEEYLKKFYDKRAEKQTVGEDSDMSSWNVYSVEGKKAKKDSAELDSLEEALCAVPMMGEKVFVRYKADLTALTDEETERLISLAASVDSECTLFILYALPEGFDAGNPAKNKPSAMYRKYEKAFKMVDLSRMTPAELRRFMERRLAKSSVAIDAAAAEMLIGRSGTSLFSLSGELDKLAAYACANNMTSIDAETVKLVASVNEEDEAFAMANAIMNGDRRKALKALHLCKTMRKEPTMVLASVGKSLCDMLTVCLLMSEGNDKAQIAQKLKMHEYRAGLMMNSVRNMKPEQLIAAVGRCSEADLRLKESTLGYIAVERFICTIPIKR